jgi:hypothetical protein
VDEPIRKRWRDGRKGPLEGQLADIIAGLLAAAAVLKEQERRRKEEERRRLALELERAERDRLRRIDAARWRFVLDLAASARRADEVRDFLNALEQRARAQSDDGEILAEHQRWFEWARAKAKETDPLSHAFSGIIEECQAVNEWTYPDLEAKIR